MSCRVVSCRALYCSAVSYCVVACRCLSCHFVSCCVDVLWPVRCRVVSCCVVSCRVVSCRVVSCRIVSCRVVLRLVRSPFVCCGVVRPVLCLLRGAGNNIRLVSGWYKHCKFLLVRLENVNTSWFTAKVKNYPDKLRFSYRLVLG